MECTQRLECTQEFFTQTQKESPEQIGFLGICGEKYPVKKGPNKIGRDPQTCNIILNLNSISRQHAVINVLNKKDFMLMDLDSANKTKLLGKTLMPYVPSRMKNGDMVQFGDVFGMFRLLEEEDNLPMTQGMDVPDTPIATRHMSKLNAATTIPESPDVSDKDDSFIVASQPKGHPFKSSNTHFIKPGKTISIQPVGGNKIDNIFWNTSKKSTSINLDDSTSSLNDCIPFVKLSDKENEACTNNIHEMNTQQVICPTAKEVVDIYEANTQMPESPVPSIHSANTQLPEFSTASPTIYTAKTQAGPSNASPSIHTANTQISFHSPTIHSLDTQLPPGENLPEVCKLDEQQNFRFDICADKDNSICNVDTQMFPESPIVISNSGSPSSRKSNEKNKFDKSSDVILFDEVDNHCSEENNFGSQAILTEDILLPINKCVDTESEPLSQVVLPKSAKRNMRIKSDSSTDCEDIDDDILLTQKIPVKKANDGDGTDCEDEMIEQKTDKKSYDAGRITDAIDIEEVATQVIGVIETPPAEVFEDLLTQVIDVDCNENTADKIETYLDFEDLPTQVLVEDDVPIKAAMNTKQISEEPEISPFKVPLRAVYKAKKRVPQSPKIKAFQTMDSKPAVNGDDKYYQDTQDIFEDLCSQKGSSEVAKLSRGHSSDTNPSQKKEKINNFVSHLSSQEVRDVIGVEGTVAPVRKWPSDSSDPETPTKKDPFKFMDIELPSSQEIKTSVSRTTKSFVSEYSSDSESEHNSEDQNTPILFLKKKKPKTAKIDLTKKMDIEALPTRIITRVRKPTSKTEDNKTILMPNFLTDQDADVDTEIITENITRLKKSMSKNIKDSSKVNILENSKKIDEIKKLEEPKAPLIKKDTTSDVVKKESKTRKSDEKEPVTEEKPKTRESNRKKKSSSPTEDIIKDVSEIPDAKKTYENTEIENKAETRGSKRIKTASKTKDEKPRGPIMIEPHTITFSEKPIKRAYKRKNKGTASKETDPIEPKSDDSKKENNNLNSTKRPVRSTRNKTKTDTTDTINCKSNKAKDLVPVEKRTRKETMTDKKQSPDTTVQRVTRQKTQQEKEVPVKSILKKSTHEQSTIYNLSTGSNSDVSLKRSADAEISPVAKRSLRATPSRAPKSCHVLFTAFPHEEVKNKLQKMGAVIVTDVMQCTVVLTLQIRRTFKLLCAVGLGKPIVGPAWVQACADTNLLVDPWLYIIKDAAAEKRFTFSLERTLIGKRNFLKGYNVSATPSVMPAASEMKLIVQCSGGTWLEGGPNWVCVTCAADRALWPEIRRRGAALVSTEFILGGVLQQRLDVSGNHIKQ